MAHTEPGVIHSHSCSTRMGGSLDKAYNLMRIFTPFRPHSLRFQVGISE